MNLHQMKYGMTQNLCVLDIAEKKLGKKKKLRAVKPYISEEAYKPGATLQKKKVLTHLLSDDFDLLCHCFLTGVARTASR